MNTPETQALVESIQRQGNVVRDLKSKKESEEEIKEAVDKLLKLKSDYKKATGQEYAAASSKKKKTKAPEASTSNDGKKSKSQLKKEKKLAELAARKEKKASGSNTKPRNKDKLSMTARSEENIKESDVDRIIRQAEFNQKVQSIGGGNTQVVTPWDVEAEGGVDYEKLIDQFGCSSIDQALIDRIEKLTGKRAHRFLRRGYFFSHRDLSELLDCYEKGEKFYLYTGRGPSSGSLHMGHLIPFTFTAWLQEVFDVPLVIQLTNDEKFLFKDQTLEESMQMMWENAKDIIACGFDLKKTFIFADTDYIQHMYPNILKIQKCVTYNQVRGIFGFSGSDNIGKSAFPAVQAAPSFPSTFEIPLRGRNEMRCLIPQAIDQDPYFRMTRDVAPRIGFKKPALIHSKFFPALQGSSSKMSASSTTSSIFVTDSAEDVSNKIKKYAFSGGGETKADHEKYGANLDVDIPYQYLSFMLEDDNELARIAEEYGSGRMMTGEVKNKLIDLMVGFNKSFQERRSKITDEEVRSFMAVRPLEF